MLNKVLLIGNLTRDVEVRYTNSGLTVGNFGLAVNRKWKDRNTGEQREDTMFIDIDVFGQSAETAKQYISKGRQVLVEGRLVLDQWTDQNGQKRSRHKISAENVQFLGSRNTDNAQSDGYDGGGGSSGGGSSFGGSSGGGQYDRPSEKKETARNVGQSVSDAPIGDDEIPF
ncbi:hypothetical protein FACS189487_04230 [Campylobacterota bacterium]|nr:hypothetical protein FACS189487_04230 [Campylobacterota bacterium]